MENQYPIIESPIMGLKPPFPMSARLLKFIVKGREKVLNRDTMKIGILWGDPGCGKSVLAQKFLYLISGGECEQSQIAFNKPEFVRAVTMHKKTGVVADEGIAIIFSRGAMSQSGRETMEIFGQMRQQNLYVIICIHDILLVDSSVLKMANWAGYVWETEEIDSNGEFTTRKGNLALYPKFRMRGQTDYFNLILRFLRIQKAGNYLIKNPRPKAWHLEKGQLYGEKHPKPFYAVDEEEYKKRKNSILKKYEKTGERKERAKYIDYNKMDMMIKAGVEGKLISEFFKVSYITVLKRKADFFPQLIKKKFANKKPKNPTIKPRTAKQRRIKPQRAR